MGGGLRNELSQHEYTQKQNIDVENTCSIILHIIYRTCYIFSNSLPYFMRASTRYVYLKRKILTCTRRVTVLSGQ